MCFYTSCLGNLEGLNRGYTGHEHLDMFGAINMNGRVYDPSTAQFFSPDPFVQSAGNWANYNRYSYCMNNPMIYTDPSGYAHKSYEQAAREAGSQDYWDGRATTFFGAYGRGGGGFTSWSYSSSSGYGYREGYRGGYSDGYDDGPKGWHPAGSVTTLWDIVIPMLGGNTNYHWEKGNYGTIDEIYCHNTSAGGYYGNYIDGYRLNGVLYEFSKPVRFGEIGSSGTNNWLQAANDISGIITTIIAGGTEGVNAYIRTKFKSATSWTGWTKLRSTQQAWRIANVIGKTGAVTLSAIGKFGGVLGGLSAGYSTAQVMNQYNNGGLKSVDPWVVGDAVAGIAGTASFVAIATGFAATNPIGWALIGVGASAYGAYRAGDYIYENFIK